MSLNMISSKHFGQVFGVQVQEWLKQLAIRFAEGGNFCQPACFHWSFLSY